MAKEITLPKLSEDADEGSVAEVLVKEGDTIEKDDSIIAVESDKATVEVPSPEAGTVKEVKVSEGDSIKTGDVILLLEDDEDESGDEEENESEEKETDKDETDQDEDEKDEDVDEDDSEDDENKEKEASSDEAEEEPEESDEKESSEDEGEDESEDKKESKEEDDDEEPEESEKSGEKSSKKDSDSDEILAAPGAKRFAREQGIDLKNVKGTGPNGLITTEDVKRSGGGSSEKKKSDRELPDFSQWGQVERQPLSSIRKATAKQTQKSWQAIPHVTQFDEADVSNIQKYVEEHQEEAEGKGGKLTITAVLTKMIATALHQFPKFNASIDMESEEVILKKYTHIGIAVDTEKGLLVPIVKDVDRKSIIDISVEISELAEKAREGKLSGEEMEGGNFIISNLGGIGGTQFTPVIYHPQVAILGVSEMTAKPVYKDGSFEPVLTLPLSLSYDHRLIDGAEGARFLRYVCNALEDPYKALLGE